jgi:ornithine carbamoyltransferase
MNAPLPKTPKHFLDLDRIGARDLRHIIDDAAAMKAARHNRPKGALDDVLALKGRMLALIFEKPSTRTRISFDMAMRQMGGGAMVLDGRDLQFGHGETVGDTARVISRYVDAIMLRTKRHANLGEMAQTASVPIVNGLTDKTHPCQLMADVMTIEERLGPIAGKVVTWAGAGNNVCASWIHAAQRFGFSLRIACPEGLAPEPSLIDWAAREKGDVRIVHDAYDAVKGADCVVTDTWVQMSEAGELGEGGSRVRHNQLMPFQVNERLMAAAKKEAIFLHCLPAHRGEEVTDSVLDGPRSAVWDEAENRLHSQKAILKWALG